jgi:hypothetical protein
MPSKKIYDMLIKKGLSINDHYNRYDRMATSEDLSALFDVIGSFKDINGKRPAITANCLLTNPDFERIKASNYEKYSFELFTETLKRCPGSADAFDLWKEGMEYGLFYPQFHGREHLNVSLWMEALQQKHKETLLAFEHGFWGHTTDYPNAKRNHFLAAFDLISPEGKDALKETAAEGLVIFQELFGFKSKSFIAPNYIWPPSLEKTLFKQGVTTIQSHRNQLVPVINSPRYKTIFHFTGQRNGLGQRYLVRNAYFEPSSDPSIDWIGSCLKDISNAFFWRTPAIISSHRVNYMGAIVPQNRDQNLRLLKQLLHQIISRWPEAEFLCSYQLEYL